jgi:hypothetical protein
MLCVEGEASVFYTGSIPVLTTSVYQIGGATFMVPIYVGVIPHIYFVSSITFIIFVYGTRQGKNKEVN